jgi:molecular chaperone GrpE
MSTKKITRKIQKEREVRELNEELDQEVVEEPVEDPNAPKMKIEKEITDPTEKAIQQLNDKIVEQKQQLDEADDRIKRLMAEFENFKKRSDKERQGLYSSVMGDVIISLLPAIDNLEKAAAANTEDKQYQDGIKMVLQQFKDVLQANNVTEIPTVGKQFDPSLHEAVSMCQDPKLGPNTIKEEFRKGYMIGDRVLRHSMVVVAN